MIEGILIINNILSQKFTKFVTNVIYKNCANHS